jgi:polyisoprenoid-binding protein YceI
LRKSIIAIGLTLCFAASHVRAQNLTWELDPSHCDLQFSVRHLGISTIRGQFSKITGTVQLDEQDLSKSSVDVVIHADSIDTGVQARDNDLKSDHFFDVAKYPLVTFRSTRIWKPDAGATMMTGDLTLHGVTRAVTFEVVGPTKAVQAMGAVRRAASAKATINRQDFGITYSSKLLPGGDKVVGDEVSLVVDIEMIRK